MSTFKDKFILDTYEGIIHSDGELASTSVSPTYDGLGNQSSLSIGRAGNGSTVSGLLSTSSLQAGQLKFPTLSGGVGDLIIQSTSGDLVFTPTIPSTNLKDLSPDPSDTYTDIKSINVNSKGLVTNVESWGSSLTITSTTYLQDSSTPIATAIVPKTTWVKVFLTSGIPPEVVTDVKSVTLYIEPTTDFLAESKDFKLMTSPDMINIHPGLRAWSAGNAGNDVENYGISGQISTIVGGAGSSAPYIFLKHIGSDANATYSVNVHLIAYQR